MVAAGARPRAGGRRRLFQAREGAAVLGLRPPVGRAGTMNRAPPTHSARSSEPGCQESPFAGAAAAAAFLGMARPSRREGKLGVVFPSFLPFFEIQIPSSGRSAGARRAPGGLSCQPPRLGGARGLREPRSRAAAARPRDGGPAWRWGDARPPRRISRPPPGLGKRPGGGGGRGCGRRGRVSRAAAARRSTEAARSPSVRPSARHATPGGPSRLATHSARPGARAARPPAPIAPRPAAGDRGRESMPRASSPRALRIGRGVLGARACPGRRPNSQGPRGAAATRPGPGFCHFLPNLQLPSEPGRREGRAGAARRGGTPPPPRSAPRSARSWARRPPDRRPPEAPLVPAGLAPAAASREPIESFCVASPPFV